MVSIWLNKKELQILKDSLGTLGHGYWEDLNNYGDVKAICKKIYHYWYNLTKD